MYDQTTVTLPARPRPLPATTAHHAIPPVHRSTLIEDIQEHYPRSPTEVVGRYIHRVMNTFARKAGCTTRDLYVDGHSIPAEIAETVAWMYDLAGPTVGMRTYRGPAGVTVTLTADPAGLHRWTVMAHRSTGTARLRTFHCGRLASAEDLAHELAIQTPWMLTHYDPQTPVLLDDDY